eukprot:Lithocolla_globosa_v1_NODE_7075_length_996_cov_2.564293.p2 type:complete len:104 gc:universal NODE_7075_length_996_cov_2.564293:843-532(-)
MHSNFLARVASPGSHKNGNDVYLLLPPFFLFSSFSFFLPFLLFLSPSHNRGYTPVILSLSPLSFSQQRPPPGNPLSLSPSFSQQRPHPGNPLSLLLSTEATPR